MENLKPIRRDKPKSHWLRCLTERATHGGSIGVKPTQVREHAHDVHAAIDKLRDATLKDQHQRGINSILTRGTRMDSLDALFTG